MKSYARRVRPDIPTVTISLGTLIFWSTFAVAWRAADAGGSGPSWALSASSLASLCFVSADMIPKIMGMVGPRVALKTLLQVAATYDRDPSNWSEDRKQYWDRETNVQNLVHVADTLDSMARVHQPDVA